MKRFFIKLLMHGIALLHWRGIQTLGNFLGWLLMNTKNRQRRDALINIQLCRPDLTPVQQRELRRNSIIHFARTYIEFCAIWLWPAQKVLDLVVKESGSHQLDRDYRQGLIVLIPHLGDWELVGLYMAARGPVTSMYRPQKHIDELILKSRQRNGAILVPDNLQGVKQLLQACHRGEAVCILPDQVTREDTGSVYAPFFGVPAVTMLLASGLIRRSGAKVVFMFAERLPQSDGFHLHCLPAPKGLDSSDSVTAAKALNQGVEDCIAICPEQYHWTYRRFRRRPDGGPSPYTGRSI